MVAAADENLRFGRAFDSEPRAAQKSFGTRAVRYPPVCWIVRIAVFDKVQLGETTFVEHGPFGEGIIFGDVWNGATASQHGLENEPVFCDVAANQIESKQRMAQVVEDAQEQHEIKMLAKLSHLVYGHQVKGDVEIEHFGGETCLLEIVVIVIDAEHAAGSAQFHLDGVKPAIAPDVENRHAGQVLRKGVFEPLPFSSRIVPQEVIWRGLYAAERKVVEPWT